MPIVKSLHKYIVGRPGDQVIVFGHTCIIQPNGEAHCNMDADFIKSEVAAGRFALVEKQVTEKKKDTPKPPDVLIDFGFDVGNYYGAGDLQKLYEKINKLKKEHKMEFAETRLQIALPATHGTQKMTDEIMATIQNKLRDSEEDTK